MTERYLARSASDRTDDWPFWFVADRRQGGLNVTAKLYERLTGLSADGATLATREQCESLAALSNQAARPSEGPAGAPAAREAQS